jgi:hypothetical protein
MKVREVTNKKLSSTSYFLLWGVGAGEEEGRGEEEGGGSVHSFLLKVNNAKPAEKKLPQLSQDVFR